jgi:hypothetical protein
MYPRRFLNKKENVPDLDDNDKLLVVYILFGILLVIGAIFLAIYEHNI